MNTNTFKSDVKTARTAVEGLNLKGTRPAAVLAFLVAQGNSNSIVVPDDLSAGTVRRGLRQLARRFDHAGDADMADVFWALRDDVEDATEGTTVILTDAA